MNHINYSGILFLGFSLLLGGDNTENDSWIEMQPIGFDSRGDLYVADEGRWVDEMEEELDATQHLIQRGGYYKRYDSISSTSSDIFAHRLVIFDVVYGEDERKTEIYSPEQAMKKGGAKIFYSVDPPRLVLSMNNDDEKQKENLLSGCTALLGCWYRTCLSRFFKKTFLNS